MADNEKMGISSKAVPESADADIALQVFHEVEQNGEVLDLPVSDTALRWKIDLYIMPLM